MLLQHAGKTYLLGLEWIEVEGGSPVRHLRDLLGADAQGLYQVIGSRRGGQLIGFTRDVPELGNQKKGAKTYSLAAAVAARGRDGIYFLDLGAQGWYAVIQDGQLMRSGGEMLMPLDDATAAVRQLSEALGLPVFTSSALFPDAQAFALQDLDAVRRKPAVMRPLKGREEGPLSVLIFLCVLGGLAYGGWYFLLRTPEARLSGAELELQAREQYVQGMLATLPAMETRASWVVDAVARADAVLPQMVAGWQLERLACSPALCQATYAISADHSTFSYHDLQARFGPSRVQLQPNMREATVAIERPAQLVEWTPDWILNPVPATAHLVDVHGLLRLRVPQVQVDQTMHRESLSQGNQPPLTTGITRELIVTSGSDAYPTPVLDRIAGMLGPTGFVPEHIERTYGRDAAWRAQWVRVFGDAAP